MTPLPPGQGGTLADLMPSAAALLGVDGFDDTLGLGRDGSLPEAVTVLLVDGLGYQAWRDHAELTPHLAHMADIPLSATVPTTTPTSLASLGTGMRPGEHGVVGASFRLPDEDAVLHPLSWRATRTSGDPDDDGREPHPQAIQPERTVFERLRMKGSPVLMVGAPAYADSGLTRAVLRGGEYVSARDEAEMADALGRHTRGLAYAYVADLDRTGHVHGVDSPQWREGLRAVDSLVGRILGRIGDTHRLIVTADHGMVDCPPAARTRIEDLPGFAAVTAVGGEPRMRHVYTRPGAAAGLARTWRDRLGDDAWVATRDEFVASGVLGPVAPDYVDRLGDVVVLSMGACVLTSESDSLVSSLLGQHGSITLEETAIPLLYAHGGGRG